VALLQKISRAPSAKVRPRRGLAHCWLRGFSPSPMVSESDLPSSIRKSFFRLHSSQLKPSDQGLFLVHRIKNPMGIITVYAFGSREWSMRTV